MSGQILYRQGKRALAIFHVTKDDFELHTMSTIALRVPIKTKAFRDGRVDNFEVRDENGRDFLRGPVGPIGSGCPITTDELDVIVGQPIVLVNLTIRLPTVGSVT